MSGPTTSASLACLARHEQAHRVAAVRTESHGVDVGARVEEHARERAARLGQRRTRPVEPAAIGVPRHVMEQRRPREVVVGRLEVGTRVDEGGIGGDETAQAVDVPGVERRHGFLEPRVRTERGERVRQLDMLFQPGPRVKAVFARDDELRVGERERRVEYRPRGAGRETADGEHRSGPPRGGAGGDAPRGARSPGS